MNDLTENPCIFVGGKTSELKVTESLGVYIDQFLY